MWLAESHLHAKDRRVDRRKESMAVEFVAPVSGRATPGRVGNDGQTMALSAERLQHGDCVRVKACGREDWFQKSCAKTLNHTRVVPVLREKRAETLGERPNRVIGCLLVQGQCQVE